MTVLLIDTGIKESNSKHGYVVEMFDTVEDFKCYIREELLKIRKDLRQDGEEAEDKELNTLIERNLTNWTFSVLFNKYKEYNFEYTFEII